MDTFIRQSPGKKIGVLLANFILAITGAILFTIAGLYYYGPSGNYAAGNILLSPDIVFNLSYKDINSKTGKTSQFSFDRIEFLYSSNGSWERIAVDQDSYRKFFDLIKNEKSLTDSPQLANLFLHGSPATLNLTVKGEGWTEAFKNFQEVQFLPKEDYYRIQLREDSPSAAWAYYHHAGIYDKALNIFVK